MERLIYFLKHLFLILFFFAMSLALAYSAYGATKKPNTDQLFVNKFLPYEQNVKAAINTFNFPSQYKAAIPAQIEHESCISVKHSKCWNSKAELKTSREYGFGLGQLTVAYKKDGSERFNAFKEIKSNANFKNWKWEDRYNAEYQIKAVVYKDRQAYNAIKWSMVDEYNKMATALTMYNGGIGSILKDRALCVSTKGCDATKWFGGIENTSYKSRVVEKGYGKSFFDINRHYAPDILVTRMPKYEPFFKTVK